MNKRDFLRLFSVASLSALPLASEAMNSLLTIPFSSSRQTSKPLNPIHYWNKGTRLTIAMWDFTWLTDHGKGGAFENLEKCVSEAAERGYNTLRIDCFPSRVLQKKTFFPKDYNPGGRKIPGWGIVTTPFECNALEKLKQLADLCRKYGIWLGLDSWEKGQMMGHKSTLNLDSDRSVIPEEQEEKILRGFAKTWVKALRMMRDEGILERAVWVAPMNEVPHFASRSLASIRNIGARNLNEGGVKIDKNQLINERYKLINLWIGEAIKDEISREQIPLSYSSLGGEEYSKRLPEIYDVVDVHFMPSVIFTPEQAARMEQVGRGASGFMNFLQLEQLDLKKYSEIWNEACRTNYAAMLARTRQYLLSMLNNMTFPNGKRMQGIITESFGPCFWPDHPDVDWEWYKRYNGDSARIAASMPYAGISLSNYGEPIFSLWKDVEWHRTANLFSLNV